jgi:hypothetical protein
VESEVEADEIQSKLKNSNHKRRLLTENVASEYLIDSDTKFYNESVTASRNVATPTKAAFPNHLNLPIHSAASERLGPDDKESMIDVEVF